MKKMFLVCMASMLMAMLGCEDKPNKGEKTGPYEINFYADTMFGHLIITTVCNYPDKSCLSASSISLGKVDTTSSK